MLIRLVNDIDKSDLLRSSLLSGFPEDVIADAAACGTLVHVRGAEEAAVAPLPQRPARRLLELAQLRPSALNGTTHARAREVPLTQEELGQLLGKSRQSISKPLNTWEQSGLIQAKYGRISIKQPDALRKLAFPDQATPFARKPSSAGRHAVRRSKEMT